MSVSVCLSARI